MTSDPVVEVLRAAADALAVDLTVWEARDRERRPRRRAGPAGLRSPRRTR